MASQQPSVVILAGPNGAGKTTASPRLIRDAMDIRDFVNADDIARGLSAFSPDESAFAAGRIMLRRLHDLAEDRATFAFETTLATRSFAPWLKELQHTGYRIGLLFLCLRSPESAIERVALRVRLGGHHVPPETVQRRHARGLTNFFKLYKPFADDWVMYNNEGDTPQRIATGGRNQEENIDDGLYWKQCKAIADL